MAKLKHKLTILLLQTLDHGQPHGHNTTEITHFVWDLKP